MKTSKSARRVQFQVRPTDLAPLAVELLLKADLVMSATYRPVSECLLVDGEVAAFEYELVTADTVAEKLDAIEALLYGSEVSHALGPITSVPIAELNGEYLTNLEARFSRKQVA